ncbi:MAG: DUF3090 family protein [Dehalococcoidia bacterium]
MSREDYARARHDLGVCAMLEPESVGPPGGRQFRLCASAERGSAILWMEKEELYELALTVKQVLRTGVRQPFAPYDSAPMDLRADFDFKIAGLVLGHDRHTDRYMLLAQRSEEDEDDAIALWVDREVLNRMADKAFEVHSSGRPRCPLCSKGLSEGEVHACPRAN